MLIPFDQLWKTHNIKAKGVLHLGASIGQEAEAYNTQGVERVIWVEALPNICAQLVQNVAKFPGHVALRACISDRDDELVAFHVANNESQSSSFLDLWTHKVEHPDVKYIGDVSMPTIRVDSLLKREGLEVGPGWFLNIDLQGAELLALKGMESLLPQFDYAYIEVNIRELYKGCPMRHEIDSYLAHFGFQPKQTKMMKQGWGDRYYSRT